MERNSVTNKKNIRKEVLAKRNSLSPDTIEISSGIIADKVLSLDEFKKAKTILLYSSFGSEVKTDLLIKKALEYGKEVYLPKVEGEDMNFYHISLKEELLKGAWGIEEPKGEPDKIFRGDKDALVVMPLVGYDREGNRIGYGKGYYDRFLVSHETGLKIGIAFGIQECEISPEPTDIRLDMLVNENEIIGEKE